jgi:ribosome biogenesis GTPase
VNLHSKKPARAGPCRQHNHVFRILTAEGERLAETAGKLKHDAGQRLELPVVGDWVALRLDPAGGRSQIKHVLPRRTWFSRKVAGRTTAEQVVAANIDTVLIVFGLDKGVNVRAIERYLVVSRRSGAVPVVVLSKADLVDDLAPALIEARSAAGDTPVIAVSARQGSGMDALESYIQPGRTLALLGPSGAGKSSIVNRLMGAEVLPTGEVRAWDARGRHTSVHRQLVVRASGGLIIDTPGMRELQLWETDSVRDAFEDIAELAASCRFRDCQHDREPGCAVKAAVDAGLLDSGRYAGYLKLQAEEAEIMQARGARPAPVKTRRQDSAESSAIAAERSAAPATMTSRVAFALALALATLTGCQRPPETILAPRRPMSRCGPSEWVRGSSGADHGQVVRYGDRLRACDRT